MIKKYLFSHRIYVLYIKGKFVELASVQVSNNPKILKHYKAEYDESNFSDALNLLLQKIKTNSVYLLLGEEFAYVVDFSIPLHIQGSEERNFVYRRLMESVPDTFDDNDWDYKETVSGKDEKEVVAFALVKEQYNRINDVLKKTSLKVITIEPDEISVTRNKNPIIGIALKNDIYGNDNVSLTLNNKRSKFMLVLDTVFKGWLY